MHISIYFSWLKHSKLWFLCTVTPTISTLMNRLIMSLLLNTLTVVFIGSPVGSDSLSWQFVFVSSCSRLWTATTSSTDTSSLGNTPLSCLESLRSSCCCASVRLLAFAPNFSLQTTCFCLVGFICSVSPLRRNLNSSRHVEKPSAQEGGLTSGGLWDWCGAWRRSRGSPDAFYDILDSF